MTTKNPNYESSAERLTNPESVRLLLLTRLGLNSKMSQLENLLRMQNTDLHTKIEAVKVDLAANEAEIRNTVLTDGGYQDCDAGLYALRQKRVTYTYDPAALRREYPAFISLTIKEIVDTTAIAGLIKGKMLDMAALERDLVAIPSTSFAFILKITDSTPEARKE